MYVFIKPQSTVPKGWASMMMQALPETCVKVRKFNDFGYFIIVGAHNPKCIGFVIEQEKFLEIDEYTYNIYCHAWDNGYKFYIVSKPSDGAALGWVPEMNKFNGKVLVLKDFPRLGAAAKQLVLGRDMPYASDSDFEYIFNSHWVRKSNAYDFYECWRASNVNCKGIMGLNSMWWERYAHILKRKENICQN